jgi:hypothetical protein
MLAPAKMPLSRTVPGFKGDGSEEPVLPGGVIAESCNHVQPRTCDWDSHGGLLTICYEGEPCCSVSCLRIATPSAPRAARAVPACTQGRSAVLCSMILYRPKKRGQRGSDNFCGHSSVTQPQNRSSDGRVKGCQHNLADKHT